MRILVDSEKDPVLDGLVLPKRTALADFFREACPELLQRRQPRPAAPSTARHVHELWKVDAKEAVRLADGTMAAVFEVREPIACVCLDAIAHTVQTTEAWRKLTLRGVQADLRLVFTEFGLPVNIQTDREKVYGRPPMEAFPTLFTLLLVGLGIDHHFTRPGRSTDQAHVEREHRTLFDWLEQPQPLANLQVLQTALDEARYMHNYVLPSDAGDCQGRPPIEMHPGVLHLLRPYHLGAELALFDLARVDRSWAQFTWSYLVSKVGQFRIAKQTYSVGKVRAGQPVSMLALTLMTDTLSSARARVAKPSNAVQLSFPW